ncbi:MAG: sulfotransferase domain-containing protein [Nocardioidaceae bacterium]
MSRHLLVIGAQRSGTTYVTGLLDAHPDITMARPARPEPKVFLSDELAARGLRWYRETYFRHARSESVLGEKSTSYLEHADAAARAASVLGSAEVLVLFRDPVRRAVSNWRFSTDHGLETRPLAAALTENLQEGREWDPAATSVSPFAYLERGRYADYLDPWDAAFPDTVHVHFLTELEREQTELEHLYGSLGVDPDFRPQGWGRPVNESEEPAPELSDGLLGRLRAYFAASDAALAGRLGRELPWPTPR